MLIGLLQCYWDHKYIVCIWCISTKPECISTKHPVFKEQVTLMSKNRKTKIVFIAQSVKFHDLLGLTNRNVFFKS